MPDLFRHLNFLHQNSRSRNTVRDDKVFLRWVLLCLFVSATTYAQDLPTSRRSSYFTFVYKLTNAEAKNLYESQKPSQAYCHTLHTLYPTDSARFQNELPIGHYLIVKTVQEKLQYELTSVNNTSLHLLNNQRDLIFIISDNTGSEVSQATVKIKNRTIAYNKKDKAYVIQKSNRRGILSVTVGEHTSYFPIERSYNNTFFVRTGKKILGTFPVNHLASVIIYPIRTVKNLITGNYVQPPGIYYKVKHWVEPKYEKNWKGYLVFNKPMFKPGDTLRAKAFITTKKGRPVTKTLDARLYNYGRNNVNLKLGNVAPYRNGAYVYELILTDSLKLSLDTNPYLQLEYRDKTVQSKSFRYEQYELKANQFFARSENNRKEKGATLYLKGTDSNDMPLYDVRTEILIKSDRVTQAHEGRLFVADTLWFHQQKLDAVGETKIVLPDSIFPKAALNYKAVIAFINSDNERQTKELSLQFDSQLAPVRFEVKNDSVWIYPLALTDKIELTALTNQDDEIFTKEVQLPYREKINPFINEYEAGATSAWEFLEMNTYDKLEILSGRTADSITITASNPRKIPFHYQVFKGKRQIYRGSAEESTVIFEDKAGTRESYTVSVQYVWAGIAKQEDYAVNFNDRQLNVSITHLPLVYPGQTTDFTITVTDAKGKPVNQADVTAFAISKKFKQGTLNQVPVYPRKQKSRLVFNSFYQGEFDDPDNHKLDWALWHKTLGLDSISFYQFLYPASGRYEFEKPSSDSITQIAPFLVEDGLVLHPSIIYINSTPVYHAAVNTIQPYSFRIHAGVHLITMRTGNYTISFSIDIKKNHKQIVSIDLKNLPADAIKIPYDKDDLEREQTTISKYFISVHRAADQPRAYLWQYDNYFLFNESGARGYPYSEIAGPLHPQLTKFVTADSSETIFDYEPFFSYQFLPGVVRQRSLDKSFLSRRAPVPYIIPSFNDQVITKAEIEKRWAVPSAIIKQRFAPYLSPNYVGERTGALLFTIKPSATPLSHLATFIINLDNPDQYFIYPANNQNFDRFNAAHYEVVLLMSDHQYLRSGKFFLQPFGQNMITFYPDSVHARDAFSEKLFNTLKEWDDKTSYVEQVRRIEMNEVRTSYYAQRNETYAYTGNLIRGQVFDSYDGSPLPGVNVIVKGTVYGTVTDFNGEYYINVPPGGTLVFSFIGYTTQEAQTGNRGQVDVDMAADVMQLNEVVVMGYGAQRRMSLAVSASRVETSLQGRIAGVQVSGAANQEIYIRGNSSIDSGNNPLIVLDGVVIDASAYKDLDPSLLTAIEVLNNAQATALYGSRAAGGVILLSTKKGVTAQQLLSAPLPESVQMAMPTERLPGNSIRKNFRDNAFWKPHLITDEEGNAKFPATFPDDITGWKVEALAMTAKKQSGIGSSTVQSYKPLLAQLVTPHFLLEGDSAVAIGKITNYTTDTLSVARAISIGNLVDTKNLSITNSHIDTLILSANRTDSLTLKYAITQNLYEDGEIRKVPVYKKGVKDADGFFAALRNDTSFTLQPQSGVLHLRAQTDALDVLLDEIESVKNYRYDCNEQLASKLYVLLAEKKIAEFRKQKFSHDDRVKRMIKKLSENQHKEGGWGWWNQSEGLVWITLHVVQALERAEKAGYKMRYDKEGVAKFLQTQIFQLPWRERVLPMQYLITHNTKVEVQPLYDSLIKTELSIYSRLRLAELMQQSGLPFEKNWLHEARKQTLKGNYYWGEDQPYLFDNDKMATVIAYRILKNDKASAEELQRIRNYFLETRGHTWSNTYQSALIIETLLPELMEQAGNQTQPEISFNGSFNFSTKKFPFDTLIHLTTPVAVRKSGLSPVYFTAYYEFWNPEPERSEKDFVINTYFSGNVQQLKAGKPITLTVDVIVKKDAEYVMLNVPIPAGCSYENKNQSWRNGEVHREYDYHQTTIFCKELKTGTYQYTISLVPRYTGKYTLNPARAEWMYFPVMYGQEKTKTIAIAN